MAKFVFNDGKVFSGGYDLSDHITSVNLEIMAEELDATTINSGGFRERLGGLKDSTLSMDGFYEAGANKPDALLGASVGNELIVTTVPDAGVGNTAYFMKSRLFSYQMFGAVGEIAPFSVTKSQSDDNSSFTSPTDRITFSNITAIGADYQSAAGAITDTYYRLNYTISGTSPSFSIHATIGIE